MADWPDWWYWPLDFSHHLLRRMVDRGFNHTDLRLMMDDATGYHADIEPGRWVIQTTHDRADWEIIIEPGETRRRLVIVTAYPVK